MKIKTILFLIAVCTIFSATAEQLSPVTSCTVYEKGDNGYNTFRIPSMVQTPKGTVLAFAEARKHSASDTGDIDLVLRRSNDGGKTWSDLILVWDDGDNVCGNPAPVVDQKTGRILLISTWNKGSDHEKDIHARTSEDSRRIFVLHSDDDGLTWSAPREITTSVKAADWTWYATGPCHAIQLQKGAHKGRIVVPANHGLFENGKAAGSYSHVIWSDDGGESWVLGASTGRDGNESTVVELKNGDLMLNMRGPRGKDRIEKGACRLVAFSRDGGASFDPKYYEKALTEPVCNGSTINYTRKGKLTETILFSNPNHPEKRKNMTIKMSKDSGKTWAVAYPLSEIAAAYSDMAVLDNGDVAILYETGEKTAYDRITYTVVPRAVFK